MKQEVNKRKRRQHSWLYVGPEGVTYDCSESGWIEANNFYKWFNQVFISFVEDLEGYKILFLDGLSSNISLVLMDKARAKKVVLFKLIAHSRHVLQHLNVAVFSPAKST